MQFLSLHGGCVYGHATCWENLQIFLTSCHTDSQFQVHIMVMDLGLGLAHLAVLAVVKSCCAAACRFKQEAGPVLEEMGSSLLQGEQSNWAGSPRGPHRRAQAPFASPSSIEDEEEQDVQKARVMQQQKQAELLLQPLQQLECVIVAGESLCRQVCRITNEIHCAIFLCLTVDSSRCCILHLQSMHLRPAEPTPGA